MHTGHTHQPAPQQPGSHRLPAWAALFGSDQREAPSDPQVRALLLHLADLLRAPQPAGEQAADPRIISCLSAAADELLDPLQPPALALVTAGAVPVADAHRTVRQVRDLLLDHERPGDVRQVLARGRAARELAEALHLLTQASPATAASAASGTAGSAIAGAAGATTAAACTCGAGQ